MVLEVVCFRLSERISVFLSGMLNSWVSPPLLGLGTLWLCGVVCGEGVTTPVGFCSGLMRGVPVLSTLGRLTTGVPRKLGSGRTVGKRMDQSVSLYVNQSNGQSNQSSQGKREIN